MPFLDMRDMRRQPAPPPDGDARRQGPGPGSGPMRTQVRKVIDANGKKWLVREVIRDQPPEPVQRRPRRASKPYQQQGPQRYVPQHETPRYRDQRAMQAPQREGRQPTDAGHRPQYQSGPGRPRTSHSPAASRPANGERRYADGAGNDSRYNGGPKSQQQRQPARLHRQEDPRLEAERARREVKKDKLMRWLLFFIS